MLNRNVKQFSDAVIVLLGICLVQANAQTISWSKLKGPYTGSIQQLTVDQRGDIFASGFDSRVEVYRSTDGSRDWQLVNSLLSYGYEPVLAADSSNNIYYGDIESGLYESTDRGTSWFKTDLSGGASAAAVISGNRLCIGGRQTMSISKDFGQRWSISQVRSSSGDVSSIVEDSSGNIYTGFYGGFIANLLSSGGGVFVSSDSSRTWRSYGMSSYAILSMAEDKAGKVFALATSDGVSNSIYSVTPQNSNWIQDAGGIPYAANIATVQTDRLGEAVAVTDAGIFIYDDTASNWKIAVSAALSLVSITTAFYDPIGISYAGTDHDGVYFLDKTSSTWVQCGVYSDSIISLGISSSGNLFAGTADGVYEEGPEAGTWLRLSDGLQRATVYQINTSKYGRILSGVLVASTSAGLFYLPNGGNHWSPLVEQWTYDFVQTSDTDYASVAGGILKSTDGSGEIWHSIQTIGLPLTNIYCLALDSSDNLFAGAAYSGIFESTDGGTFWTQTDVNSPIIFYSVKTLEIDNEGRMFAGTDTSGAYYSDDSGVNWNSISSITGKSVTSFLLDHPSRYFVGTSDRGVFMSTDRGSTWQSANDGITDSSVTSLIFDEEGYLYAATTSGIFKSANIVAGIHEKS